MKTITKNLLLILVTIAMGWVGCKKEEIVTENVFEGIVKEYGTDKPLKNAFVQLFKVKGEFLGPSQYTEVDAMNTNEDGKYRFVFEAEPGYAYEVRAVLTKYFGSVRVSETTSNYTNKDIILEPYAYILFNIKKESSIVEVNTLTCFFNGSSFSVDGNITDTVELGLVTGNLEIPIYWRTYKNNTFKSLDSMKVLVPAHDTVSVNITY